MVYSVMGVTPQEVTEKINQHVGYIDVHNVFPITVTNDSGLPVLYFVAFFSVREVAGRVDTPQKDTKRYIGQP
jgi:hypothetical protein